MATQQDSTSPGFSRSAAVQQRKQRVTKEIVGDYTVTTRPFIGSGTFGRVCKAEHNKTHVNVAVKEIPISHQGRRNEDMCRMADREMMILRKLNDHDNIVNIIEYVMEEDTCWIFMEYCSLGDLKVYLGNTNNISFISKVKIMHQSASALAFMHRQEPPIIHRDIKLENIMMTNQDGHHVVKVTDFGLSKVFVDDENTASFSAVFQGRFMTTACGSQFFLAPEFFAERRGGLQYDHSIDIFALGLVFLVLLDYGEHYPETLPLSLSSKRAKVVVNIGTEMIECHRQKRPLPKLVEKGMKDDVFVERIKRIITFMTQFESVERKNIQEIDQEFLEILAHLNQSEAQACDMRRNDEKKRRIEDEVRRKEQENRRLQEEIRRKELEMRKKDDQLRSKDKKIGQEKRRIEDEVRQKEQEIRRQEEEMRRKDLEMKQKDDQLKSKDENIHRKDEEIHRLTQMLAQQSINSASNAGLNEASCKQQTKAADQPAAPATVQLSTLVTKSFKRAKIIDLQSYSISVHLRDDEIWSCCYEEIYIHTGELQHVRTIRLADSGYICSVAALDDGMVAVAAHRGLIVITKEGEKHRRINHGRHTDVCTHAGSLYTTYSGEPRAAVHVYSTHTWQRTRVIDHPCASTEHFHRMRVNGHSIVLSCTGTHCIYTLSMDGQLIEKHGKQGSGIGEFNCPCICMSDGEGCLLVADACNDRLQVRHGQQWSVPQLQPQPSCPDGAVYDGHSLYVLTLDFTSFHLSLYT